MRGLTWAFSELLPPITAFLNSLQTSGEEAAWTELIWAGLFSQCCELWSALSAAWAHYGLVFMCAVLISQWKKTFKTQLTLLTLSRLCQDDSGNTHLIWFHHRFPVSDLKITLCFSTLKVPAAPPIKCFTAKVNLSPTLMSRVPQWVP